MQSVIARHRAFSRPALCSCPAQVWFQLGVIIACTVYVLQGLDRLRSALMSYLTITTTLTMSSANTYVYFNYAPEVQGHSATQATAAGAVISSIAKCVGGWWLHAGSAMACALGGGGGLVYLRRGGACIPSAPDDESGSPLRTRQLRL